MIMRNENTICALCSGVSVLLQFLTGTPSSQPFFSILQYHPKHSPDLGTGQMSNP